jgi:DHA2 family multidrug resistance protein
VSEHEIIVAIVIQGGGMGLVFTPLQVLAFATLPASMRTEGASLFSLLRNIGAAIGVSVTSSLLAHNSQALHEMIGASVNPFNRALQTVGPMGIHVHRWLDPASREGAALLDRMINQQAQIVAYVDDYVLLIMTTLPALLLLLLMRMPRKATVPLETQAME